MASKTGTARTTRRRLRSTDEPDPPEPVALSDALPRLASALDEAAEAAGWGGRPSLVRVTAWPSRPVREGFDLGIRPLEDDRSVVEALSGFTAPSEWTATTSMQMDFSDFGAPVRVELPAKSQTMDSDQLTQAAG